MKKMILVLFVATVSIFLSMGTGDTVLAEADSAAVHQAIVDSNAQWMAALGKGDASGIAARYAQDARLLPPNSPEVAGRAAIQAFFQFGMDAGMGHITLTTADVTVHGGVAIERGTYTAAATASGDGGASDHGKYIVIWMQEDGEWKMSEDMWNSDLPAA